MGESQVQSEPNILSYANFYTRSSITRQSNDQTLSNPHHACRFLYQAVTRYVILPST